MALVQDRKINVQGFLDSLSGRQGSAEEDLLAKRRQSISQSLSQVASESPTPFKSSLATLMGDTLGKGLLRAFNIEDEERQRAIDTDKANKLIVELQKTPSSANLFKIGEIKAAMGDSVGAAEAFGLANQVDQQTEQSRITNLQQVEVANQAVEAGYPNLAELIGNGTLSPQEGYQEIVKRKKEDAELNIANAAAAADIAKAKGDVKVVNINDKDYLMDSFGNLKEADLPANVVENMKKEQDRKTQQALLDVDMQLNALDDIEELAINKGAAGEAYNELSMHPYLSRLGSFTAGVADAITFGAAGLGDETGSAYNLSRLLDPLKSDITFAKINALKSQSDTGATGLGQISNVEINLLQNSIAALDPAIGEEAFKQQLDRVRFHYQNVKDSLLGKPPQIDVDHPSYDSLVSEIEVNGQKVIGLAIGDTVYIRD